MDLFYSILSIFIGMFPIGIAVLAPLAGGYGIYKAFVAEDLNAGELFRIWFTLMVVLFVIMVSVTVYDYVVDPAEFEPIYIWDHW